MSNSPDWTPYSVRIRAFFRGLFASRYAMQLEADLEEARRDRDYFRARAERLELLLIPNRQAPARPMNLAPIGRPSWGEVQAEHNRRLEEEAKSKKESN